MARLLPASWVLLASVAAAVSCGNPTAPCDPRGSNEADAMYITCSPVGSDLRCVAHFTNKYDLYVCTAVDYPVASATVWTSSDASAGVFDPIDSGLLHAVSPGRVEVSARYTFFDNTGSLAYFVSPGAAPSQLVRLEIAAREDVDTTAVVPGVSITVTQDGMTPQQCTTDSHGNCISPPRLWVFKAGGIRIVASKGGYVTSDTTQTFPGNSVPWLAKIALHRDGS